MRDMREFDNQLLGIKLMAQFKQPNLVESSLKKDAKQDRMSEPILSSHVENPVKIYMQFGDLQEDISPNEYFIK